MREWILQNTTINAEEYDHALEFKDARDDVDLNFVSKNSLRRIMLTIESFTLAPKYNRLLSSFLVRRKKNGSFSYKDITFRFFHDIYKDPTLFMLDRYGKCALMSFNFARVCDFDVVTANCIDFRDETFLHTFLVRNEMVYDYTRNLIMAKEDYYRLMSVQEIKVIPSDIFQTYASELENYVNDGNTGFSLFEFLCFPDEIIKAMRNNSVVR